MKVCIFIFVIALFAAGCGKEPTCEGVTCAPWEECDKGACIEFLEGNYHWVGRVYHDGVHDTTWSIDDTSTIITGYYLTPDPRDNLKCRNAFLGYAGEGNHFFESNYKTFYEGDSGSYYIFYYVLVRFTEPFNDTAYYSRYYLDSVGSTRISLKGARIH